MKRILAVVVLGMGAVGLLRGQEKGGADGGAVKEIALPRYVSELPLGEGREAFGVGCLVCHSASYVNMQSPMTPAKWEESVRKMMKVYGAPVAEEDVGKIVGYIVEVKEKGEGIPLSRAVVPRGEVPGWLVEACRNTSSTAIEHGAKVYAKGCASCHGEAGRGDGKSSVNMLPRPSDLTTGKYSAEGLAAAMWHGVPGTAMPGYRALPEADLKDLVAFVASIGKDEEVSADIGAGAKELYGKNCAQCHGAEGRGDGLAGVGVGRRPADFHARRPTQAWAERVIAEGVPGTAMPGWKAKLSEGERRELAAYVRSFYGK